MSNDDEAADDENDEIEDIETVVTAVVEYLREEDLLAQPPETAESADSEYNGDERTDVPVPVVGADGREFY